MRAIGTSARLYRFGVYEVDLRAGELRKHGLRIKLQEQPCQILSILLEQPGQVVTREELRQKLWPGDTFVDFDHSLNTAIMRLREALGDSSDNPRFVETLPRRGYRFIAPVEGFATPGADKQVQESPAPAPLIQEKSSGIALAPPPAQPAQVVPKPERRSSNPRRILIVAGLSVAGLIVLLVLTWPYTERFFTARAGSAKIQALVVLPMENLSGDKEQEYFADGMTDELIASLAKIRALRVISRTSAMEYKGTHKPLAQIARELNVGAVVEGTVLRSGNRVRITAELVQASTDQHLWAETYESDLGDILTLQGQVARAIANQIRITLTPEEQVRLASVRPVDTEAFEAYLKGRYYWNKRSREGLDKAIGYFQQAIEKDPKYALAHAGLADCYGLIATTIVGAMSSGEAAPKTKAAALKALEIDDTLAEAHTSLASMQFNYDWDWPAAERGFKRALELDPGYATAHQRYSLYLIAMGRTQESVAEINRARELDPLSISINFSLGWRLYMARQFDPAIEQLRNTIEMDPEFLLTHLVLGQAYGQKGAHAQAIAELQRASTLSRGSPMVEAALGHAYGVAGKRKEAQAVLDELGKFSKKTYVSPFYVAIVYAGLGKKEEAIDWLEKAYQDRSNGLVFIKVDPELDSLRSHPRFQDLLRRMGVPQ